MYDLVAFLRARLDEDEQVARETRKNEQFVFGTDRWFASHGAAITSMAPHRAVAEVDAKRRAADGYEIAYRAVNLAVDRHLASGARSDGDEVVTRLHIRDQWELAAKLAALPYADHPDYREEWKP